MSSLDSNSSLLDSVPVVALSPDPPLGSGRALTVSLPVAGVLLLWTLLSWIAIEPAVGRVVRATGVVMALGYVLVRGLALGAEARTLATGGVGAVVGQNVRAAVAPAVWFLAAVVVHALEGVWNQLGLPGMFVSPAEDLAWVCALTGLGTALLLVVAGARAAVDARAGRG